MMQVLSSCFYVLSSIVQSPLGICRGGRVNGMKQKDPFNHPIPHPRTHKTRNTRNGGITDVACSPSAAFRPAAAVMTKRRRSLKLGRSCFTHTALFFLELFRDDQSTRHLRQRAKSTSTPRWLVCRAWRLLQNQVEHLNMGLVLGGQNDCWAQDVAQSAQGFLTRHQWHIPSRPFCPSFKRPTPKRSSKQGHRAKEKGKIGSFAVCVVPAWEKRSLHNMKPPTTKPLWRTWLVEQCVC